MQTSQVASRPHDCCSPYNPAPLFVSLRLVCVTIPLETTAQTDDGGTTMPARSLRLRVLLEQRHWQNHRTFCAEYEKAALSVDPRLRGTAPSRAQLHRWLSGELQGLPYGDHCRVLEEMFPEWSARQLFESVSADDVSVTQTQSRAAENKVGMLFSADAHLVTSGSELSAALIDVVRNARKCLVAVGSRSSEPTYLQQIEQAMESRQELIHYRILIGQPHSQVLKDHLLRLLKICDAETERSSAKRLYISIRTDLTRYYERFFVASEQAAVAILPSGTSPMNFDTGLVVHDSLYVQGLLQHGKALYSKHRLEAVDAVSELEVLG